MYVDGARSLLTKSELSARPKHIAPRTVESWWICMCVCCVLLLAVFGSRCLRAVLSPIAINVVSCEIFAVLTFWVAFTHFVLH